MIVTKPNQWVGNKGKPSYRSARWYQLRAQVRFEVLLGLTCAHCGGCIDLVAKAPHPLSFMLGHVRSRAELESLGYTDEQIDTRANVQAEHYACGRKHGSALGARARNRKARARRSPYLQQAEINKTPDDQPSAPFVSRW